MPVPTRLQHRHELFSFAIGDMGFEVNQAHVALLNGELPVGARRRMARTLLKANHRLALLVRAAAPDTQPQRLGGGTGETA